MLRELGITLGLVLLTCRAAAGLEIAWSSGGPDLLVSSSAPCTLLVRSTQGDSLFMRHWRFVWTGTAEVASPLTILPSVGTAQCIAPTTAGTGPLWSDSVGRVQVAVFRREDVELRPPVAMLVLRIHPSLQARIALVSPGEGLTAGWTVDTLNCLTINGGSSVPFAPVLLGLERSDSPTSSDQGTAVRTTSSSSTLRLSGLSLTGVEAVSLYRASHEGIPELVDFTAHGDTALVVELPFDLGSENAELLLERADGAVTAAPVPTLAPLTGTKTYDVAAIADSVDVGPWAEAGLAVNPVDASWTLHYRDWLTEGLRFRAIQDGVWATQIMPDSVAPPYGRNLDVGEDGVAHLVGPGNGGLLHWSRALGGASQWSSEMAVPVVNIIDCVARVDTTDNSVTVVYSTRYYGHVLLLWARREGDGTWGYAQYIEAGYYDVLTFDMAIGADGRQHVAYARLHDDSTNVEIVYAWRDGHEGAWTKEVTQRWGYTPRSMAIGYDEIGMTPLLAYIDYHFGEDLRVLVMARAPMGEWWAYEAWYGEHTPWWVDVATTPAGLSHVVFYEAGDSLAANGGPGRLIHVERESVGQWTYRPWSRDTIVASDDERLGQGEVVPPLAVGVGGGQPLIAFGYRGEGLSEYRLCLASPGAIAAVPAGRTPGPLLTGPWPNPSGPGGVVRVALESPVQSKVECSMFDVAGKRLRSDTRDVLPGGREWIVWEVADLPAGVYFIRARSEVGSTVVRKWVVLR